MKSLSKAGLLVLILLTGFACKQQKESKDEPATGTPEQTIVPVRIQAVESRAVTRTLNYTANLVASKEIHYAPASPGRIDKIYVEVGNRVKKGQLLVESDRTQLIQAQTQLQSARDNFQRIDTLYKLGSIAEQQYEQAKTQLDLAKSNVDFLTRNTTLTSPINGIVTGKYFENGELYSGAPNTQAGKAAVLSLMQINPLKVVVNISQSEFNTISEGLSAAVYTDIMPETLFEGKISRIYPTIDPITRTFKTEILISNPEEKLRPGMFATIEIEIMEEEALLVPAISVLKQSGTNRRYLFVHEQGTARQIDVKVGKRFDELLEVQSSDLEAGMELIIEGQSKLLNGSAVKITDKI